MTEALCKVVVDTSQVKQGNRTLEKAKNRLKRMRSRAMSRLGIPTIPTTTTAIGAAAGFRFLSRFSRVGVDNVDPWAEAQVPLQAAAQQQLDRFAGKSLRANRAARKETAAGLGFIADEKLRTALSRKYYKFADSMKQSEEAGRNIIRRTIRGPNIGQLVERATQGYVDLIVRSFDWLRGEAK
jgi:hypothetical protein